MCRTNRVYAGKSHGLVVHYHGIFDVVAQAFLFDDASVDAVTTNLAELRVQLPDAVADALAFFPLVDRTVGGRERLQAAQNKLPDDVTRDAFARGFPQGLGALGAVTTARRGIPACSCASRSSPRSNAPTTDAAAKQRLAA